MLYVFSIQCGWPDIDMTDKRVEVGRPDILLPTSL